MVVYFVLFYTLTVLQYPTLNCDHIKILCLKKQHVIRQTDRRADILQSIVCAMHMHNVVKITTQKTTPTWCATHSRSEWQ